MARPVTIVDVFASTALGGNPVAVVHDAGDMTSDHMLAFTRWMNLSECTFLQPVTAAGADYRVRIFTPDRELSFAGHPTLGTCHAWLEAGGQPKKPGLIVQQCEAGLVTLYAVEDRLAFDAPPVQRTGPVDDADLDHVVRVLGIEREEIVDAAWTDNGPGWVTVLLKSADAVLALKPDGGTGERTDIGVVGLHPSGREVALEVRAFFTDDQRVLREDPVTGSLNAAAGEWLVESGRLSAPYVAAQGTAMGRSGRIHIDRGPTGKIRVGGVTQTIISGRLERP